MTTGEVDPKVGQRVRWRWPEPASTEAELNGKITAIRTDLKVMVKFDDGSEEECDWSDLEPTT